MASSRGVRYANEMPFELLMMWNVGKRRGLTRKWVAELANRPSTDRQQTVKTRDKHQITLSSVDRTGQTSRSTTFILPLQTSVCHFAARGTSLDSLS